MPDRLALIRAMSAATSRIRLGLPISAGALALVLALTIVARSVAAQQQTAPVASEPASTVQAGAPPTSETGGITEDELRTMLVGKELFLRGGYLDNDLGYNEHGILIGHSPQGSYTLCEIQIDKVHLSKHKVETRGPALRPAFSRCLAVRRPNQGRRPGECHAEEKRSADHH